MDDPTLNLKTNEPGKTSAGTAEEETRRGDGRRGRSIQGRNLYQEEKKEAKQRFFRRLIGFSTGKSKNNMKFQVASKAMVR